MSANPRNGRAFRSGWSQSGNSGNGTIIPEKISIAAGASREMPSPEIVQSNEIVNRVAMLHEGVILALGTPDEIVSSEDPVVHQFIKGEIEGPISYR